MYKLGRRRTLQKENETLKDNNKGLRQVINKMRNDNDVLREKITRLKNVLHDLDTVRISVKPVLTSMQHRIDIAFDDKYFKNMHYKWDYVHFLGEMIKDKLKEYFLR